MWATEEPIWERDGRDWPNREASRFVKAAGLPEFACDSENEYAGKAAAYAADRAALAAARAKLREGRDRCLLFDMERLTRSLEGLYVEMARREAKGRTPRPNLVNLDVYHELGLRFDIEAMNRLPREAYLQAWREALAEYDMSVPLAEDGRLWAGAEATRRQAAE